MLDDAMAYVINHDDTGWSWQVMNWDGETVAAGFETAEAAVHGAIAAVMQGFRSASFDPA
jgi:hypothetical protein